MIPKQPFAILQRNAKFYSCTHSAIRFFTVKCKIFKLYPNGHFVFYNETQNFENCIQTAILFFTTKNRILKVVLKWSFVFPTRKCEI